MENLMHASWYYYLLLNDILMLRLLRNFTIPIEAIYDRFIMHLKRYS